MTPRGLLLVLASTIFPSALVAQARQAPATRQPDWSAVEQETMEHFQALLRMDTSDPPGVELPAATYIKEVLEKAGIPVQLFAREPSRPNVVARLKGSGKERPVLIMGHMDVVNVDPSKWTFPPFTATRNGGYVYGRGAVDDKDNVTAALMTMLLLKRMNVPLDRDVIFLAESGEEGSSSVGIQYMVTEHFPEIDAEYCLAEGGNVERVGGAVRYASVQTLEKLPRAIELTARGISGHGSIPLRNNAIVHLAQAVAAIGTWRAPIRLNSTTRTYFDRLAGISTAEDATRYRALLTTPSAAATAADDWLLDHEPRHSSMLRTSISPVILQGGYRVNVIPSEAKATLDVRTLPDEDLPAFLEQVRKVVNDTMVRVAYAPRGVRPGFPAADLGSVGFRTVEEAIKRNYQTVTLPTMGTGATDMAFLRDKGEQCYGIGPAIDVEDGPKGFGAHSDQERILESELHRFVKFNWDVVSSLAGTKGKTS